LFLSTGRTWLCIPPSPLVVSKYNHKPNNHFGSKTTTPFYNQSFSCFFHPKPNHVFKIIKEKKKKKKKKKKEQPTTELAFPSSFNPKPNKKSLLPKATKNTNPTTLLGSK
jgi:hypothetical protein